MYLKIKRYAYLFFNKWWFAKLVKLPILTFILPVLTSFYYAALDIFGDDWVWIKDHREIHETIFTLLFVATMFVVLFRAIAEQYSIRLNKQKEEVSRNLLKIFNSLVTKKKRRFFEEAANIRPSADCFKRVTKPDEQLKAIFDSTIDAITTIFNVNPANLTLTIIEGNNEENKWWYALQSDHQTRLTSPKKLMENVSTARYCFDLGQSLFIPDMRKGIKDNVFLSSDRSKSNKEFGSIFCKPVVVKVEERVFKYVFTICLYGELLCTPDNEEESRVCEEFFNEISDRVELELYLRSIKKFRYS